MSNQKPNNDNVFVASSEARGKARMLRAIAIILWLLAVGAQVTAISMILKGNIDMTWLITLIVIDLALAVTGAILWKKSNRLHPPSEQNKLLFFMQSQLGLVVAIIAFLPLIIVILTNKDMDTKQKGILGGIAGVALLIAGVTGIDFDPPSVEKYTRQIQEQTATVKALNFDSDNVFWSRAGNRYHIFEDCQSIRGREGVSNGTVEQVWEDKGISELCGHCRNRAIRERNISEADLPVGEDGDE